jgi:ribosomal-protein-alanine N-acetyltransferase
MNASYRWGEELPTLQGRKTWLRSLTAHDAASVFEVFGDPEVMKFWSSPPLVNIAAAQEYIAGIHAAFEDHDLFQWGVVHRESNRLIGTCTLFQWDAAHRRAEIGFALRRMSWGRGLATDAVQTLIEFAFADLGLHRLEADADPHNARSLSLLERQGFRREGVLRERWHHLGQIHDAVFLGLLKHEWVGRAHP